MLKFLAARWKAVMPLFALAISEGLNLGFDLHTPAGWKAFGLAVVSSLLVHGIANTPPAPVAPAKDQGSAMLSLVLLVVCVVLLVVLALWAGGHVTIGGDHVAVGLAALAAACWVAASIAPPARKPPH
jgi:hypothetical protein